MAHSVLPDTVLDGFGLSTYNKIIHREGLVDDTFIVNRGDSSTLIRRRGSRITAERVAAEHALITYLASQGFPAWLPLATSDGESVLVYQERLYEAFPYDSGEPFEVGRRDQIKAAGRLLGRYHKVVRAYRPDPPYPVGVPLGAYLDLASEVRPVLDGLVKRHELSPEGRKFARGLAKELRTQAATFKGERIPRLIVHGSFEPESVTFGAGAVIVNVGNWMQSRVFGRAFEVAYGLLRFAGRRPDAQLPGQVGPIFGWPRVEVFIEGYRESVTLNEVEARLVPSLILAIRLRDALYMDGLTRNYAPRELRLLYELNQWLRKNGEILGELLTGA
jgi:Ser/Thr protein kinase RdoA (MazF antagonist)